jgi:hypothetical protein
MTWGVQVSGRLGRWITTTDRESSARTSSVATENSDMNEAGLQAEGLSMAAHRARGLAEPPIPGDKGLLTAPLPKAYKMGRFANLRRAQF